MLDTVRQDLKYAARGLRRTPGFTLAAVLTLALGIGATTAIFSVVNGVVLRPLPYPDAHRLVAVWNAWDDTPRGGISPAEYLDYLARADAFAHFGVYVTDVAALTDGGEPERVAAGVVSYGVLPALGVQPQQGRLFAADDDRPGSTVAILTDGLWRRRFAADPRILGQRIVLDGIGHTVVGVLPAGFRLPADFDNVDPAEIMIPLAIDPANLPGRGSHFLSAVGRLREGVSVEQASAAVRAVAATFTAELPNEYPPAMAFTALALPLHEDIVGDVRPTLIVLLAAVAFVLLIACGNITHLFLSRGERRREEFSIRAALGAGRLRRVRQTLIESGLVAAAGGLAGIALAAVGLRTLLSMAPADLPRLDAVALDGRVLAFGLSASVLVGLAVGLAPALRTARGSQASTSVDLRGVAGAAPSRQRLRRVIIASEVALALVLALGAGLLLRSFLGILSVDPGFQTERILTASITLPDARYPDGERTAAFYAALLDRLRQQPGVVSAGAVSGLPLTNPRGDLNFQIEGRETPPGQRSRRADWQVVTSGYFEAIGMRVLRGRGIERWDRSDSPGVVVVNEAAARLHWPAGDAIGARMKLGGNAGPGWVTVVGIVNDVRHGALRDEPRPEMYLAHAQFRFWGEGTVPVRTLTVVARSAGEPAALSGVLRREVAALDAALPVDGIRTMESVRSASVATLRFVSTLLALFAGVALAVTLVGVYGVVAYSVSQRRRELGVRVALGAAPAAVIRSIVAQAFGPAAVGLGVGIAGGIAASALLRAQLYGVTPYDAATVTAVSAIVGTVALLACAVPAFRAARLNPVTALRSE